MRLIQSLCAIIIFSLTTFFSQSTLATLLFTYTSQELPLLQGYRDGEADDSIGSYDPPFPIFSAAFIGPENSQTVTFDSGNLTAGEPLPRYLLLKDLPATNSSITLSNDGSISAWNFSLAITQMVPETLDNPLYSRNWLVESSYGIDTCNCDKLFFGADLFVERPFNTWNFIGTIGFLHGGLASPGNWSIEKIDVSEPGTYILLLTSLGMIVLVRLRSLRQPT